MFQISQNIAHPGRTENGTPGPMSVLPRQFNPRSYHRVVEYVRGVKKHAHTASPTRSDTQPEHGERPDKQCKRWRTEQTEQTFPRGSNALTSATMLELSSSHVPQAVPRREAPSALRAPRASDFPRSHALIGITTVLSAHTIVALHPLHHTAHKHDLSFPRSFRT